MTLRHARITLFAVFLTIFSANYLFWGVGMATGSSNRELFGRFPYLVRLAVISQFMRVYDSPFYYSSRNEVRLTYADGRTATENIIYKAFRNPLDSHFFFHVWYWGDATNQTAALRKERLLRLRFCRPGVKSAEWKIHYLEGSLTVDLGRTDC